MYNKAVEYLTKKYGKGFSWKHDEMSEKDRHIALLVSQYAYGRTVRKELEIAMLGL